MELFAFKIEVQLFEGAFEYFLLKIKLFGQLLVNIFISFILHVLLSTTGATFWVLIISELTINEFDVRGLVFVLVNFGHDIEELKIINLFFHVHEASLELKVNLIGKISIVNYLDQHCHNDDDV